MSWKVSRYFLIFCLGATVSCTGRVNFWDTGSEGADRNAGEAANVSDPSESGSTTDEDGGDVTSPATCTTTTPGDMPLRRMTAREYNNSVRDLFPGVSVPEVEFSGEETVGPFAANVVSSVDDLLVEQYQKSAVRVADNVMGDLSAVLPCADAIMTECVRDYVQSLGLRIYRRPLSDEETTQWMQLYSAGNDALGEPEGLRLVMEGMLQSPFFLYRSAAGDRVAASDEPAPLDDYEMASRLSYFVAGTIPDDELLQAARDGKLSGTDAADELGRQARRLLDKPSTRAHLNDAMQEWLGLDALSTLENSESIPVETVRAMRREVTAFIDHILWEEGGSLRELLTADYTFLDNRLAEIYGVEIPQDSEGMVQVQLDPNERVGLLTLPGVLAAHATGTSSIFRGLFISDVFLCTPVPERPTQEAIDQALEEHPIEGYGPETPERDVAQQRIDHPMCGACHKSMESVGLVFDNYAADGRYRTEDDYGNPLSSHGEIFRTQSSNGTVDGVSELAEKLVESPEVEACVARNWFKYTFARGVGAADGCTTAAMTDALKSSDGDIKEMLVSVVTTDAFRYRAPKK